MANDQLTVKRADGTVFTLRSEDVGSNIQAQVVLVSEGQEKIPTLTGATLGLIAVTSTAVALDPPDAGARTCFIRAWETTQQTNKRLFYRRDGTNPTANGANCEGYLMHGEGRMVRLASLANFKVISEASAAWEITCEFSNT